MDRLERAGADVALDEPCVNALAPGRVERVRIRRKRDPPVVAIAGGHELSVVVVAPSLEVRQLLTGREIDDLRVRGERADRCVRVTGDEHGARRVLAVRRDSRARRRAGQAERVLGLQVPVEDDVAVAGNRLGVEAEALAVPRVEVDAPAAHPDEVARPRRVALRDPGDLVAAAVRLGPEVAKHDHPAGGKRARVGGELRAGLARALDPVAAAGAAQRDDGHRSDQAAGQQTREDQDAATQRPHF